MLVLGYARQLECSLGEVVLERWSLCAAVADALGELPDAGDVVGAVELVAGEVPVDAFACAGGVDVGAFAGCLPATGEDDRAVDGRALLR